MDYIVNGLEELRILREEIIIEEISINHQSTDLNQVIVLSRNTKLYRAEWL